MLHNAGLLCCCYDANARKASAEDEKLRAQNGFHWRKSRRAFQAEASAIHAVEEDATCQLLRRLMNRSFDER